MQRSERGRRRGLENWVSVNEQRTDTIICEKIPALTSCSFSTYGKTLVHSETIRCSSSTVESDSDSTSVLMRMAIVAWCVTMNSRI